MLSVVVLIIFYTCTASWVRGLTSDEDPHVIRVGEVVGSDARGLEGVGADEGDVAATFGTGENRPQREALHPAQAAVVLIVELSERGPESECQC